MDRTKICTRLSTYWQSGTFIPSIPISHKHGADFTKIMQSEDDDDINVDLKYTLLHQKLNMLNCCIYQKWKRGGYGNIPYEENKLPEALIEKTSSPSSPHSLRNKTSISNLSQRLFGSGGAVNSLESIPQEVELGNISSNINIRPSLDSRGTKPGRLDQTGTSWKSEKSWEDFARLSAGNKHDLANHL